MKRPHNNERARALKASRAPVRERPKLTALIAKNAQLDKSSNWAQSKPEQLLPSCPNLS